MHEKGFTLVELLAVVCIVLVLSMVVSSAGWKVYEASSLAVSASNIRLLAAGGMNYLAENNNTYWPYKANVAANGRGTTWWFGFETAASIAKPEGQRDFNPSLGPLGGFIPKGFLPDPSLALGWSVFKPKYRSGYIGTGYNVLLGGGFLGIAPLMNHGQLSDPSKVVVFFTSAQVNTFQAPASASHPMLEEFYGADDGSTGNQASIHFRSHGKAMVSFASGTAGFLPMDESTRDTRMPNGNVGRFAPVGNSTYFK